MFALVGFAGLLEQTRARAGGQGLPHQPATPSRAVLAWAEGHAPMQHPGSIWGPRTNPSIHFGGNCPFFKGVKGFEMVWMQLLLGQVASRMGPGLLHTVV